MQDIHQNMAIVDVFVDELPVIMLQALNTDVKKYVLVLKD